MKCLTFLGYIYINMRDKVTRQRPQTTTFEADGGELKLNRTEVLLLVTLMPYHEAKLAHRFVTALFATYVWVSVILCQLRASQVVPQ